jgi:AcrR family transcriptional regulator
MRRPIDLPPWPEPDPHKDPVARAVVDEALELGPGMSAAGIARRADISIDEFHERFAGPDECLLDSFDRLCADFEHRVGAAFNSHAEWRSGLRAAAYETAAWLEENPQQTKLGAAGVLRAGNEMARIRRESLFVYCAEMIDLGRQASSDPDAIPESAATVAIGSIIQLLAHRLQQGVPFDPWKVVPEMMYGVVRVYLGDEAADEELTLPPPAGAGDLDQGKPS